MAGASKILEVRIDYDGPLAMKRRDINRMHRGAIERVGKYWRRFFLPTHFTPRGADKYGYAPRKFTYNRRKQKTQRHRNPLEFFGLAKREAKARKTVRPRANSKVVRVEIPLPRKFSLRHPRSRVNMQREIRTVTPDETKRMEEVFARHVRRELSRRGQQVGVSVTLS